MGGGGPKFKMILHNKSLLSLNSLHPCGKVMVCLRYLEGFGDIRETLVAGVQVLVLLQYRRLSSRKASHNVV